MFDPSKIDWSITQHRGHVTVIGSVAVPVSFNECRAGFKILKCNKWSALSTDAPYLKELVTEHLRRGYMNIALNSQQAFPEIDEEYDRYDQDE
jgi:hypothetical protein